VSVGQRLVLAGIKSHSSSDDSVYSVVVDSVDSVDSVISEDTDDDSRRCCRL
jgi:hypothetical protein